MESAAQRPLPDVDDSVLSGFFDGTRKHELLVQDCRECSAVMWPPRVKCANCGSFSTGWVRHHGTGTLFSWTRVHHAAIPFFALKTPYVVAVIELDGLPVRMIGELRVPPDWDLAVGASLTVSFEDVDNRVTLPFWMPVGEELAT